MENSLFSLILDHIPCVTVVLCSSSLFTVLKKQVLQLPWSGGKLYLYTLKQRIYLSAFINDHLYLLAFPLVLLPNIKSIYLQGLVFVSVREVGPIANLITYYAHFYKWHKQYKQLTSMVTRPMTLMVHGNQANDLNGPW